MKISALSLSLAILLQATESLAQTLVHSSDLGTTGLIDIPSARMQPDATLSATYSRQDSIDVYSLTYQATPWLETTFRYASLDLDTGVPSSDDLRDRSFGLKVKLLNEREFFPEVAVGVQDFVGTGLFSGEYLVGSKRIGDFDVTAGVGWGRFADRGIASNPMALVSSTFEDRTSDAELRFGDLFSGDDIGLFGGIEYRPKGGPLSLIAEYNSDAYQRENQLGATDAASPVSVGIKWEIREGTNLGMSWQHGSQLGLNLSSRLNTSTVKESSSRTYPWNGYFGGNRDEYSQTDLSELSWFEKMQIDADASGYEVVSGKVESDGHAIIEYINYDHILTADAARHVMISANEHLPEEVDQVTLVVNESGLYPLRITYKRLFIDNHTLYEEDQATALRHLKFLPGRYIEDADYQSDRNRRILDVDFGISSRLSIFDPSVPLAYQVFAAARAKVNLSIGWELSGQLRLGLVNNYDDLAPAPASDLPRVRTDTVEFLRQGETGIDYLYAEKRGQVAQGVYYHAFAGFLEQQYAGAGGEVLYTPFRSRIGFGANLIAVKQREFDGGFGARDLETTTGHISAYWASPFYNFDFAVHAGRYLAGDWGATFEATRSFPNGWSIGLFATLTDASADAFGEGSESGEDSFDKGLVLSIPFDALSIGNYRRGAGGKSNNNIVIRPVLRDGGARIDGFGAKLWQDLRRTRYDSLTQTESRLLSQ